MTSSWVINASPLIALAGIHHEHLFNALADEIIVPRAVAREVTAGPPNDRARILIARRTWKIVPSPAPPPMLLAWDLGAGETAVLAYALAKPGWTAILDDGAARRCATAFGLPYKGTLAVIVQAKSVGLIPSAKDLLHLLMDREFRVDIRVVTLALSAVGETWP